MNRAVRFPIFALGLTLSLQCTNYSSDPQIVNPPIILGIETEENGHLLTVAAQNTELGFFGYRLFQGATEDAVRDQDDSLGTDCGPLATLPENAVQYFIEVKPDRLSVVAGSTDRLCAVPATLSSGNYVILRSLIFSATEISTSEPSNAILVP